MKTKDILVFVDEFVEEIGLKDNPLRLDVYYSDITDRVYRTECFWTSIFIGDEDKFYQMLRSILSVDLDFRVDLNEEAKMVRFLLKASPKTFVESELGNKETLLDRFRYTLAFYCRLLIVQKVLREITGRPTTIVDEKYINPIMEIKARTKDGKIRKNVSYKVDRIDFSSYVDRLRNHEEEFYKARTVLTITEERGEEIKEEAISYLLTTGIYEDESKFEEVTHEFIENLSTFEGYLNDFYQNDDTEGKAGFDLIIASHHSIDSNFNVDIIRKKKIKILLSENPKIYLDTPVYDDESKIKRAETIVNFYLRTLYAMSSLSVFSYIREGEKEEDYNNLTDDAKKIYEEYKDALGLNKDISKMD